LSDRGVRGSAIVGGSGATKTVTRPDVTENLWRVKEVKFFSKGRFGAMLIMSAMLLVSAMPVDAATVKFGAKLAAGVEPSNSPVTCDHELNGGSGTYACTWIMLSAYNGGTLTAPKTGTINKIKLIAWTSGSFKPVFAKKSASQFKVITVGPKVYYHDGCNPGCVVQTYNITPTTVHLGEYLGIQTGKGGPMRCNSGSPNIALFTPVLPAGGGYQTPDGYSGCQMMVQVVYAS
jgi:hypothetical protein